MRTSASRLPPSSEAPSQLSDAEQHATTSMERLRMPKEARAGCETWGVAGTGQRCRERNIGSMSAVNRSVPALVQHSDDPERGRLRRRRRTTIVGGDVSVVLELFRRFRAETSKR